MRIALHSTILDGAVDDYRAHHARIPSELRDLFAAAGIHEWTIWRSGRRLFHVLECDDFASAMATVDAAAANARWQADIGRFVGDFYGPEGEVAFAPIDEVWDLSAQRTADAVTPQATAPTSG